MCVNNSVHSFLRFGFGSSAAFHKYRNAWIRLWGSMIGHAQQNRISRAPCRCPSVRPNTSSPMNAVIKIPITHKINRSVMPSPRPATSPTGGHLELPHGPRPRTSRPCRPAGSSRLGGRSGTPIGLPQWRGTGPRHARSTRTSCPHPVSPVRVQGHPEQQGGHARHGQGGDDAGKCGQGDQGQHEGPKSVMSSFSQKPHMR